MFELFELFFGKSKRDKQFGKDVFFGEMLGTDKPVNNTPVVDNKDHHSEDEFYDNDGGR